MTNNKDKITVFWSWQSDTSPKENRNFIEGCLKKAAKKIGYKNAIIIEIDRDTKNVGGAPKVFETILTKIRIADVFVWDATLVYSNPRPSPNPNVLIEYGYALSILGDGRLIGVMNIANKQDADGLPFDLQERRWPIRYSFSMQNRHINFICNKIHWFKNYFQEKRSRVRNELINDLASALQAALNEPKKGVFFSDVDYYAAKALWAVIDSDWMRNWAAKRFKNIQFEVSRYIDRLYDYLYETEKPENKFNNAKLKQCHEKYIISLKAYLSAVAEEMIYDGENALVISVKRSDYRDDYDEEYDRQIGILKEKVNAVYEAWESYVSDLRGFYPEIIWNAPQDNSDFAGRVQ
ncbi:MAG: hypothetical protein ACYSR0_11005 [Planctomycetota bacterium]|jgi:hypothetical protein